MSRHVIQSDGRREVVVGWDPPLGTFFAQIFAPQLPEDEDDCIWRIGYRPNEVKTVERLGEALQGEGVALPATVCSKLLEDQAEPWEPGPLQRAFGFTGKEDA
jgi:hypothetical protein